MLAIFLLDNENYEDNINAKVETCQNVCWSKGIMYFDCLNCRMHNDCDVYWKLCFESTKFPCVLAVSKSKREVNV